MKADVKQLKDTAINTALPVIGGLMVSNAIDKVAPIKNEKIKGAIPIGLGLLAITFGGKQEMVKNAGVGMVSFGTIKTLRTLLAGSENGGVGGITDNPTVQKMVDYLLPNLGNANDYPIVYHNPSIQEEGQQFRMEPITMDVDHEVLDGIENPYTEESLGYSNPYAEDRYF